MAMAMLRAMPEIAPFRPTVREKGIPISVTTKAISGKENLR